MPNVVQPLRLFNMSRTRAFVVVAAFTVGLVGAITSVVVVWVHWFFPTLRPPPPEAKQAPQRPAPKVTPKLPNQPISKPSVRRRHPRPPPLNLPLSQLEEVPETPVLAEPTPEPPLPSVTLPPAFEVIRPKPPRTISAPEPPSLPTPPPSRGSSILCPKKAKAKQTKSFLTRNDPPTPTTVYKTLIVDHASHLGLSSAETLISEATTALSRSTSSTGPKKSQLKLFGRRPSTAPSGSRPTAKRSFSTGSIVGAQAEARAVDEFGGLSDGVGKPVGRSATVSGQGRGKEKETAHAKVVSENDKGKGRFGVFSLRPSKSIRNSRNNAITSPETAPSSNGPPASSAPASDTEATAQPPKITNISPSPKASPSRRRFSSLFGSKHPVLPTPLSVIASTSSAPPAPAPVPRTQPYGPPYNVLPPIAGDDVVDVWTRRKRASAPAVDTTSTIENANAGKGQHRRRQSMPAVDVTPAPPIPSAR